MAARAVRSGCRPRPSRSRTRRPASRSRPRTTSPARTSSRRSRGSRRQAASSAGAPRSRATPSSQASLATATDEQRRVRRELAAGRSGPDSGASLELGIGGSRNPAQLKCLHAHVAFALAQPGLRPGRAHPRRARRRPLAGRLLLRYDSRLTHHPPASWATAVRSSIRRRECGRHGGAERLGAGIRAPARRGSRSCSANVCTRRWRPSLRAAQASGGTFTLRELAEAYVDSDRWAREAVFEITRRSPGWPRTLRSSATQPSISTRAAPWTTRRE